MRALAFRLGVAMAVIAAGLLAYDAIFLCGQIIMEEGSPTPDPATGRTALVVLYRNLALYVTPAMKALHDTVAGAGWTILFSSYVVMWLGRRRRAALSSTAKPD